MNHNSISTIQLKLIVKIVDVIFDSIFKFGEHARQTKEKPPKLKNILENIAGSDWGCTRIAVTYKAFVWSLLIYSAPSWGSTIRNTDLSQLQLQQNIVPRPIVGCLKIFDIIDLHYKVDMLSVKVHTELVEFMACCYQSHQTFQSPNNQTSTVSFFCTMRPTVRDSYRGCVKQQAKIKKQKNRKENKKTLKPFTDSSAILI